MQIITEGTEAKSFLSNFRETLNDSKMWHGWGIIDITAKPPLDWIKQAKITTLLRALLTNGDGSIVWLDESILVVLPPTKDFSFETFGQAMHEKLDSSGLDLQINFVSIPESPDLVLELLGQRHREKLIEKQAEQPNYKYLKNLVPNIDDLLQEWHQGKHKREGREKPTILIVDDDAFTLKLVSQALEKQYDVITAKNGAEAITRHLQSMPDIIFLDIGLPDCDGITLLDYMQQYDGECRIVMFSADTFLKTRVKAMAGGAKGYLSKPFNLFKFQEHIKEWMTQKGTKGGGEQS